MSSKSDGMNYAPKGKPAAVVGPGEFKIAAMHLDHGHIYGMCNGLTEAGAEVKWVYDPDPEKVKAIYGEIQDIVHDKAYYVPLFYRSKTLVWRKGFKGVTPDPLSRHNFRYAYLEEK